MSPSSIPVPKESSATLTNRPNQYHFEDVLVSEYQQLGRTLTPGTLQHLYTEIHGDGGKPTAALCISGGGIRSATFGLGVLQGLAKAGVLGAFDYLSTVSGGGYIGSWLTAWIHNELGAGALPLLSRPLHLSSSSLLRPA